MKFIHSSQPLFSVTSDLLIIPVFEGDQEMFATEEIIALDKKLLGNISTLALAQKFRGKKETVLLIQTHGSFPCKGVLLVGMGKSVNITVDIVLSAAAIAIKSAKKIHAQTVSFALTEHLLESVPESLVANIVTGAHLGNYAFHKYKNPSTDQKTEIESIEIISSLDTEHIQPQIERGELIGTSVTFARDLINEPPSLTTPTHLADIAKDIAKKHKDVSVTVLSRPEMEKLGMGALLSIAQGGPEEPKFIHLTYTGGNKKVITLVGKGITFDTGGLSLKSSSGMETMKLDMAGAAVILAVFNCIQKLHPDITLHGLIPATENMPGPTAVKPGDIVKAMNGKTIEILNTDAEGRVVLADAISYAAAKIKSDVIIDFATLTGACMVALGEDVAGLFSNTPTLAADLKTSAAKTGERIWELPLVEEYKDLLKSPVADIKNIGNKYGGAITGALFIEAFVPEHTPWAHLDIAGPSFAEKNTTLCPHGGTGFGIRMILDYVLSV